MKSREMPPTLVVQLWKESRLPGGSMIPLNLCLTWEASCSDQNVRSKLVHGRPGPCWSLTRGGSHVAWKRLLLMIMTRWWTLSRPRTSEVVKGLTQVKSFCIVCYLSMEFLSFVIDLRQLECLQKWDEYELCHLSPMVSPVPDSSGTVITEPLLTIEIRSTCKYSWMPLITHRPVSNQYCEYYVIDADCWDQYYW